jgi:3-deoxy-manno-octulosonate cytidylyltransferase (CMP-KDO synthetase)
MKLIEIFRKDTGQVDLASLMREIKDEEVINNPNNVKVVTDQNDFVFFTFGDSVS